MAGKWPAKHTVTVEGERFDTEDIIVKKRCTTDNCLWLHASPPHCGAYIEGKYIGDITELPEWAQGYIAYLRMKLEEKDIPNET